MNDYKMTSDILVDLDLLFPTLMRGTHKNKAQVDAHQWCESNFGNVMRVFLQKNMMIAKTIDSFRTQITSRVGANTEEESPRHDRLN